MNKFARFVEMSFALAAALLVICAAIIMLRVTLFLQTPWLHKVDLSQMTYSDWGTWAQAIGSIVAILGAYVIGERQSKAALLTSIKIQNRASKQAQLCLLALCDEALQRALLLKSLFCAEHLTKVAAEFQYNESYLLDLTKALDEVPLYNVGGQYVVKGLLMMKEQLSRLCKTVGECKYFLQIPGDPSNNAQQETIARLREEIVIRSNNISVALQWIRADLNLLNPITEEL